VKRPDRLVDLALRFPSTAFDLVGPEDGSSYASAIVERARALPNLTVHGAVPRTDIPTVLRRAAFLLCTSEIEGFPNTFLEAWGLGVPVISTFDPGDIVERGNLGWIADPERLAETLARVLDDPEARRQAGARGRQHFVEHHTLDAVMPRFERLLMELQSR
jgi:glycosyltransferase involved in cell wall biosynthesis